MREGWLSEVSTAATVADRLVFKSLHLTNACSSGCPRCPGRRHGSSPSTRRPPLSPNQDQVQTHTLTLNTWDRGDENENEGVRRASTSNSNSESPSRQELDHARPQTASTDAAAARAAPSQYPETTEYSSQAAPRPDAAHRNRPRLKSTAPPSPSQPPEILRRHGDKTGRGNESTTTNSHTPSTYRVIPPGRTDDAMPGRNQPPRQELPKVTEPWRTNEARSASEN